jgi:hypothetical protein
MSGLALFFALAGTSYAAVAITGLNIKDGSVRSIDIADGKYGVQGKDVKDGTLQATDLSVAARALLKGQTGATGAPGAPGTNGATGSAGTPGTNGATGPRGFSAWDPIPSGTTVTGFYSQYQTVPNASELIRIMITLPGIAPAVLTSANVNFAGIADATYTDASVGCTGSNFVPTAPAGKVCIYTGGYAGATTLTGEAHTLGASTRGFEIRVASDGAATPGDELYAFGSWAYTAP